MQHYSGIVEVAHWVASINTTDKRINTMKYQIIELLNGCVEIVDEFNTKKEALEDLARSSKPWAKVYKGSGYKKIGTVKQGAIFYRHPVYGIDYSIRLVSCQ